jgi:hypothetical protein
MSKKLDKRQEIQARESRRKEKGKNRTEIK